MVAFFASVCQPVEMDRILEPDQWPINQSMVFEITPDKEVDKVGISTKDGFLSFEKLAESLSSA